MNLYLEPEGFLGTGASLLADLTLVAYLLLLIPGMIVGYVFARLGKHRPHHKWLMVAITVVNWLLIVVLMLVAYRFDVIENIARQPGNARYLVPTLHGLLGIPAQLLATYVVYRMLKEDRDVARAKARGERKTEQYWFKSAKWMMWVVFTLWLATSVFGVVTYLVRYDVLDTSPAPSPIAVPAATPEVGSDEDSQNDASSQAQPPVSTPEVQPPATTPEADDDGGSGHGGDENEDEEENADE